MRYQLRMMGTAALAIGLAAGPAAAQTKTVLKMATLAPGSSSYTVGTSFARVVMKYLPDIEIRINATGAGTRQTLDMARGKLDFAHFGGPAYYWMTTQTGPYRKIKDSKELVKGLRNMFSFPLGAYTMVTYADSGIEKLAQIKGRKIFLGPPGGGATRVITALVTSATGYKPGKDFQTVKMGWAAAQQAFQDRNLDVWISPTNNPAAKIRQIALSNRIRILSIDRADLAKPAVKRALAIPGRTVVEIPPDVYGKNQVNDAPALTLGTWLGFGTRADVPAETVYRIMKAFWENIDEVRAQAAWLDKLRLETTFDEMAGPLHPGAVKYYREKGLKIPARLLEN
jgi:uncharacterized protein